MHDIRHVVIWKLVNGEWRAHVDIFNSNVNPRAPASVDGLSTYCMANTTHRVIVDDIINLQKILQD